jgi:hypothetical protein
MDMNGGSLPFLANQLVRNSMGNAINKSDPERCPHTGAKEVSCITVRDKKGKYFIKFSVADRLSLDKGPFNG